MIYFLKDKIKAGDKMENNKKPLNFGRTDLIYEGLIENKSADIYVEERNLNSFKVYKAMIDENQALATSKKKGTYFTIIIDEFNDELKEELKKVILELIAPYKLTKEDLVLFVGLGNLNITPDALGPKIIDDIFVTSHIYDSLEENKFQNVATFTPGVTGTTGIDTHIKIEAVIKAIKPRLIITFDALCARNVKRINKTIQLTDTGITPGSGVGNDRKELSLETLGIPVIAIGVPTVTDSVTISADTINYLMQYLYYEINKKKDKENLYVKGNNFMKEDFTVDDETRKILFGEVGLLSDSDKINIIEEVLTPEGLNYIVSTKDIDEIIENLKSFIGNVINYTFHERII